MPYADPERGRASRRQYGRDVRSGQRPPPPGDWWRPSEHLIGDPPRPAPPAPHRWAVRNGILWHRAVKYWKTVWRLTDGTYWRADWHRRLSEEEAAEADWAMVRDRIVLVANRCGHRPRWRWRNLQLEHRALIRWHPVFQRRGIWYEVQLNRQLTDEQVRDGRRWLAERRKQRQERRAG